MAMVVQLIREARKQSPSVVLSYSPRGAPACYYPLRVSRNVEASGLSYWDCRSSTFPRRRRRPFLAPSNSTFQFDIRESRRISALASAPPPVHRAGAFLPR